MLLESYTLEIFNSECMPGAMAVHCFAHLDQDVGKAIPYLNAVLGGFAYIKDTLSVTFKSQGSQASCVLISNGNCKHLEIP